MAESPPRGKASHLVDDHLHLVDLILHRQLAGGRDAADGEAGPGKGNSGAGGKPSNAAPTDLLLSDGSVAENAVNGTVVGTVTAVDPDSSSGFTYSLTDNAGGRFAINSSTGLISVANGTLLDFESATSHTITVRVRDSGGKTYSEQFRIDLIDQPDQTGSTNRAPTDLALAGSSVDENAAVGTVVGTVTASDPDAGETFTYSLTDTAGGRFAINGSSGRITVAGVLDYEQAASHQVIVKVTDHGGLSYSEAFTIAVRDVAEGGSGGGDVDPTPPPSHVDDGLYYGDPYRWNAGSAQGSPATVKYTFLQAVPGYYAGRSDYPANFAPFSDAQKAAARDILAFVQDTTNLAFVETTDINQAQMTFGLGAISGNWGYAWRPSGSGVNSVYGDVWMSNASQTVNVAPGTYGKYVLTHEIGHAIGLQHPDADIPAAENSQKFTVMSYNYYQGQYPLGYQVYDQAVLQQLYGKDASYRSGDDTYTVTSQLLTIQDQGGVDTLIGSGKIDLNAGRFSGADTWAIAYGTTIENAVGGAGNDVIIGNEADNRLTGGAGADTFVFEANWNNDVITDFQDGLDRIEFRGSGLTFAQLALSTGAGGAVVAFGDDDITLSGFDVASLTASDFLFG